MNTKRKIKKNLQGFRTGVLLLAIGAIPNIAFGQHQGAMTTLSMEPALVEPAVVEEILITLDVPLIAQQTNMWCWAASGEMIMTHLAADDVDQCTQANNRFARADCCTDFQNCVIGGWPEFSKYGFFNRGRSDPLTFVHMTAQMTNNKPVGFAWAWTAGGAHYMVIRGVYQNAAGAQYLFVNDPWPWNANKANGGASYLITYDEWIGGPDHGLYWIDYDITVL